MVALSKEGVSLLLIHWPKVSIVVGWGGGGGQVVAIYVSTRRSEVRRGESEASESNNM